MGLYLEPPVTIGKAAWLIANAGATEIPAPDTFAFGPSSCIICVIENGPFDAAGVIFDERELHDFLHDGTGRPRTWLLIKLEKAKELAGSMWDVYIKEES